VKVSVTSIELLFVSECLFWGNLKGSGSGLFEVTILIFIWTYTALTRSNPVRNANTCLFCGWSVGRPTISTESVLNLNNVNQLIFVMVKCSGLFEVRTEFLNNI
jgi:hypothetical protein